MEPAVLVDGGRRGLRHLVVALHDVVAAGDEFADDFIRAVFAGLRVDDLAFDAGERGTDRIDADVDGVGRPAHGASGGRFRLAVDDDDLLHVHLVDDILHDGDRTGRARHDAGAHVGEVGLREVVVGQHGDEHGRDAVEGGDVFIVDAGEGRLRREVRDGQDGAAVGHGRRHGEDHAEAVEHGDLDHHAVRGREVHAVADGLAVVDDVVVGQHDALRETGGTGGVLHVADVVDVDRGLHAVDLLDGSLVRILEGLFPGQGAGHPEADRDDVPEERQALRVHRLARFVVLQFGAQFIDDVHVVGVPVAVDHDEGMGVRLTEQVLRLVDLVSGVHGDEDRADLRGGPEGQEPGGNVGGPDGDLAAGLDAEGHERSRELVDVVPELGVRAGVVEGRELDGGLVRELFDHAVEDFGEGLVDELFLLPDIAAGVGLVPLEVF